MVAEMSPTKALGNGTRPSFQFSWGNPEKCIQDASRMAVYVDRIRVEKDQHRSLTCGVTRPSEFAIGIRRNCSNEHSEDQFNQMQDIIKNRFSANGRAYRYEMLVDGVRFINVGVGDLGINFTPFGGPGIVTGKQAFHTYKHVHWR